MKVIWLLLLLTFTWTLPSACVRAETGQIIAKTETNPQSAVARIDEHKRYLVQPVAIENGTVTAHLGDAHYIWIYRSTTSHVEYREC